MLVAPINNIRLNGEHAPAGEPVEVDDIEAKQLIRNGYVVAVEPVAEPKKTLSTADLAPEKKAKK